jgi:hypothetical protein
METRPAPLGGMLGHRRTTTNSASRRRATSAVLLKQLVDGSVLLHLNTQRRHVFTSAIWTLDSGRGTLCFNAVRTTRRCNRFLQLGRGGRRRLPRQREGRSSTSTTGAGARQPRQRAELPVPRVMYRSRAATPFAFAR